MFENKIFDLYDFDKTPLDTDLHLRDEIFIKEYEASLLEVENGGDWKSVGLVSYVAARRVNQSSIELSWFPNIFDRFHELSVVLPRNQFVACVGCWTQDETPSIFVKSEWLKNLHLRSHSVFGLIDAVNIKQAINNAILTRQNLQSLKEKIDEMAVRHEKISFISAADSLFLKSNWTAGHFQLGVKYTYQPEVFIHLFKELKAIYCEVLGLDIYGVFTQGSNEYYEDSLLHISQTKNHVCLNSLGTPFAELLAIDDAARKSIKTNGHLPCEIYMDSQYFNSLRLNFEFRRKQCGNNKYISKMNSEVSKKYFYSSCDELLANLE